LAFLHKTLKLSISKLIHSHPSTVIRAIISSIQQKLHEFQLAIENIEKMILTRDDSVVGAYDIVPLARLTTLLGEWDRIIGYLCGLVGSITMESTGAQVFARLQQEQHTGYPDIAHLIVALIATGEEAWLRQVSSWVLYGRLPQLGHSDFFIFPSKDPNISTLDENAYIIDWDLWPTHLSRETGSSILFIGRALARIQTQSSHQTTIQQILKAHLEILGKIQFPLSSKILDSSIKAIRLSLSSSVLSHLLPRDTIIRLLKRFRQDFLLGHGSLMITLLSLVDEYFLRRNERDGGTIKEAEVNNLLSKAWSIISRLENRDDDEDPERHAYEAALKLSLLKTTREKSDMVEFDEFLLGERVQLKYEISWPLDLFFSRSDIEIYNKIFNFLLAVKRAQGQINSLWPGRKSPFVGKQTWTALTYVLFFIDSLWGYFQVLNTTVRHMLILGNCN
jgi:Gamma tubulin complex component N-terminal/Gamma tubulin complex component C-terminal